MYIQLVRHARQARDLFEHHRDIVSSISAYSLRAPVLAVWKRWFKPASSAISKFLLPAASRAFSDAGYLLGRHLYVLFAVDGQHRTRDFPQRRRRIVFDEIAE